MVRLLLALATLELRYDGLLEKPNSLSALRVIAMSILCACRDSVWRAVGVFGVFVAAAPLELESTGRGVGLLHSRPPPQDRTTTNEQLAT
jgi:hypothetical protein